MPKGNGMCVSGLRAVGAPAVLSPTACGGGSSEHGPYGLEPAGTMEAAVSTDQPPFASASKAGAPQGYIVDITNEVAKGLKLKVSYKASTVPAALQGLTSG